MDETARFAAILNHSAQLKRRLATDLAGSVLAVVDACEASLRSDGKIMFCGNGGSAADAQHLATELLVRLRGKVERESWPALALGQDPAMLTAAGNDYGFSEIFARPLAGLGRRGDVLFGITTSGRSPNVVRALEVARGIGIVTVGLLGGEGMPARDHCDHVLLVPDDDTARIQECHITLGHAILEILEDRMLRNPMPSREGR